MGCPVKLYKLFKNDEFLGLFSSEEIMKKVGISRPTLKAYTSNALLFRGEWQFDYSEDNTETEEVKLDMKRKKVLADFCSDWDKTRSRLRNSGADLSRYVLAPNRTIWK